MSTILIVYASTEFPLRSAVADHLYALERHSQHHCVYLNAAVPGAWAVLRAVKPDVIVFHTIFLAQRWSRRRMARFERRIAGLRQSKALKLAFPQDEFIDTEYLCDFLNRFRVDHVYSVAPESEWGSIYRSLNPKPTITRVLTGYLDAGTVARLDELVRHGRREIDIGYRAKHAEPWLGGWGRLKVEVGRQIADAAPTHGLSVDVSTRAADTLFGDNWMRFLVSCRYVAGVEGGASIHDRDGSLMRATRAFVRANPSATFEEVAAACFPDRDGESGLKALSPRHLEAAAARTGQILIEGDYNGVLRAGEHYLALRPDFGNLDEVLESARDEGLRQRMTDHAYREIVASGRYSYETFVTDVLEPRITELRQIPGNGHRLGGRSFVRIFGWYSHVAIRARMLIMRWIIDPIRHRNAAPAPGIRRITADKS